jgi:hypothetical protein
MVRLSGKSGLALLLLAGFCLTTGLAAQTAAPKNPAPASAAQRKPHSTRKKAAVQPEAPQAPAPPPTLEQSPPTPPQVSYQNGQLTITAMNATLGQVLRAVQTRTGSSLELPSSAANERVVTQLGPGRATDVLNALLNGSKFNYIILGESGNPGAVQKIILTTQKQVSNPVNTAQNNPVPSQRQEVDPQEEEIQQAVEEPQPTPPPPAFHPQTPMGRRMPEGAIQPPNPNINNADTSSNNGAKTPDQLLQELQQMQQQQQEYQQQLNPANRPQQQ